MALEDVDVNAFEEVLNLWYGKEGRAEQELGEVMVMASVADRLEMLDVFEALETAIIGTLCPEVCAEVLMSSRRLGLGRVEEAGWKMSVRCFDEVCRTTGFMGLDEETVGKLLEEDELGVTKEEEAFEGLVGWMMGDTGGRLRGLELLGSIRFGVMEEGYLEEKARAMLPEEHREWMDGLVGEALRAKAAVREGANVTEEVGQLGAKALTRRRGRGVDWGRYCEGGGGRRLKGHSGTVRALVQCAGRMCSGSRGGSILVWKLDALEVERVLLNDESGGCICSLAVWEDRLISGHLSGRMRVWDVTTGERRQELGQELEHFTPMACSLCVVGSRLASAHRSIKVYAMSQRPEWPCERTLKGHTDLVASMAGWEGKLISGSGDRTIRVWELETGRPDATLAGHRGAVDALLVHGGQLFSASKDGTIRAWAVGTWAAVASLEVYDFIASWQWVGSLAASGSKLVSGSWRGGLSKTECEVRVWDIDSLACEHTLRQPTGADVWCLAAAGGEVWGGVGSEVVVWGRE